jgi:catechol-2,3-dioxygenase
MPHVTGLGHIGLYVRDVPKMAAFYRDFLGMQVTKEAPDGRAVFLSSDPEQVDHEIALMTDPSGATTQNIQQISMRVPSFEDLQEFHRRILADPELRIDQVVTHLSSVSCYFFDPEGNRTEVFWLTGRPSWVMVGVPIDLQRSKEEVLAEVDRVYAKTRHVPMGAVPDAAAITAMREAVQEARERLAATPSR